MEGEKVPVYMHSAAYAREHGELEQYRSSRRVNIACKNAIEEAVRDNFDGMHLKEDAAKAVVQEYGAERVAYILADTVRYKDWDRRFSSDTKSWAESIPIVSDPDSTGTDRSGRYVVESHPAILNGFIGLARKEFARAKEEKNQEILKAFLESEKDSYAILQLKQTEETAQECFMNYKWLRNHGKEPQMEHYDVVYTGRLHSGKGLEDLFVQFNLFRPDDFTGHSLSVSDIVALRQGGVVSCYYVDSVGFCKLPDFHPENYLKNAEMLLEDDLSMVDGVVNNGPKNPEKERPSVREKLKNTQELMPSAKPVTHRKERGLE
ncbi:MAG: DUF3849 domain-containing protein [Lachnospiraceae bacterium]|nr:DUF3849 domain-containing protein [Lachnospiraceae bacterium]